MAQAKGNKAKGRQSAKGKSYYSQQFFRTTANKARRAKRRERLANSPAARRRQARRSLKWATRYHRNLTRQLKDQLTDSQLQAIVARIEQLEQRFPQLAA